MAPVVVRHNASGPDSVARMARLGVRSGSLALAMQKVVGSNPIIRSRKPPTPGAFLRAESATERPGCVHHRSHASDAGLLDEAAAAAPAWEPANEDGEPARA